MNIVLESTPAFWMIFLFFLKMELLSRNKQATTLYWWMSAATDAAVREEVKMLMH